MSPPAADPITARDELLAALGEGLEGVDRRVDPRDSMFRATLAGGSNYGEAALFDYFRSGATACDLTVQLLRWRFGPGLSGLDRVLEFGAGFGRVTRFLVREVPGERLWSAEVDPAAVGPLADRFGVHALASTVEPERFDAPGPFDAIVAWSVLSHLPERRFHGWLRRWLELMPQGGMLAFSVLGESTLPAGEAMPSTGFRWERWSESHCLPLEEYAVARVSADYVERALERAAVGPLQVRRFPRALWHLQDVYVVVRGDGPDPASIPLRLGPVGYLDSCRLDPSRRRLDLEGWAVDRDAPAEPPIVRVLLDGERLAESRPVAPWPGVEPLFGSAVGGWSLTCELDSGRCSPGALLRVSAVSAATDREYVLHVGGLDATMLWLELEREAARARELDRETRLFEAGRFGRLRRRWLGLKRWLRRHG